MLFYVVLGTTVLLAPAIYWVLRKQAQKWHARQDVQHFHCPRCGQKMRYLAGHAGRVIACPTCWKRCTLPEAGQAGPVHAGPHACFRNQRISWNRARVRP